MRRGTRRRARCLLFAVAVLACLLALGRAASGDDSSGDSTSDASHDYGYDGAQSDGAAAGYDDDGGAHDWYADDPYFPTGVLVCH